ncbi:hypothetical protein LTR94_033991, partial [Friedmanniomyces endolithicus]
RDPAVRPGDRGDDRPIAGGGRYGPRHRLQDRAARPRRRRGGAGVPRAADGRLSCGAGSNLSGACDRGGVALHRRAATGDAVARCVGGGEGALCGAGAKLARRWL